MPRLLRLSEGSEEHAVEGIELTSGGVDQLGSHGAIVAICSEDETAGARESGEALGAPGVEGISVGHYLPSFLQSMQTLRRWTALHTHASLGSPLL